MNNKLGKGLQILLWIVTILLMLYIVQGIVANRLRSRTVVDIEQVNRDWAKLMLVLENVDRNYVDDVDKSKVTEEILPEIMSKLDPHSLYFPPQDLKEAEQQLEGSFDGIGIQFNVPADTAIVTNVISGGPSEKAGLISGDRIIKVDTITVAGVNMPQDSMVSLMRGKRGTKVNIGIKRNGEEKLVHFVITRDKIPQKSVDVAFMINDTTGYLKLSKFAKTTYYEFLTSVASLKDKGMKKLIFDLRDNTGGFLDQALLISNEFLHKGELVFYMEGRKRPRQDVIADGTGSCRDIELAVLINEVSASSSEIVAGAVQDNDRATIYGVRSFGKGLVQEPVYFSDGSGIRLTVARYHTPTGRCIQKPYSDDYAYDLIERYRSGELMNADSIKVNDSLKYTTPKGKVVYGGGGIIPDVFVPLDTTGVTDYLVKCNRQSAQVKFAIETSDKYRAQMRDIRDMGSFYKFLDGLDLKRMFIAYTKGLGFEPTAEEWKISGEIILTQIKAVLGRYTPLDDEAFYPIYLTIDNTVKAALED